VLGWVAITVAFEGASFRLAYLVLPLWAAMIAGALTRLPKWLPRPGVLVLLAALASWALWAASSQAGYILTS
jgi:MFS superfamily sulfate permease-like transporter